MKTGLDILKSSISFLDSDIKDVKENIVRLSERLEKEKETLSKLEQNKVSLQKSIDTLAPEEVVYSLSEALDKIANEWGSLSVESDKILGEGPSFRSIDGIREQYERRNHKEGVCKIFYLAVNTKGHAIKSLLVR